jgi:hypothetical protein
MKRILIPFVCLAGLSLIGTSADDEKAPAHLIGLTALTDEPVEAYEEPELPCAVGGPSDGSEPWPKVKEESPHHKILILVHVNQVLLDYRRKNPKSTDFPIGSVLLKEKFAEGAKAPHLYTRMERKSLKGEVKDWEFSAVSLDGSEDPRNFKASRCMSCHDDFDETGFVSESSVYKMDEFLNPEAAPDGDSAE